MRELKVFLFYWLLVLVWMVVIFAGSNDTSSFQHSSRIIGRFVHWLFPHISPKALDTVILLVRKLAHMTEYGILALLIFRALRHAKDYHARTWNPSTAFLTLAITALYAATDEFHQAFVPSREASARDVCWTFRELSWQFFSAGFSCDVAQNPQPKN